MYQTRCIPLTLYPEGVAEASQIFLRGTVYQNYLPMRNTTADVTSDPFYDIHGRKREVLSYLRGFIFCILPETTRDGKKKPMKLLQLIMSTSIT
jgi:hypothetical protein